MGLWDSLWELGDIAKDIVLLPFEIGKAVTEFGQDITETVSQDIKNKIEGNPEREVRTSYTIKDEAEKIIQDSGNLYWNARDSFTAKWNCMTEHSETLLKERDQVYTLLGRAIRSKKLAKLPDAGQILCDCRHIPAIDSFSFDFGTYIGSVSIRMEAAEDYLIRAKEYRTEVNGLISKIKQMEREVLRVTDFQCEERKMLSAIRQSYKQQDEFTLIESANILHDIAELCLKEVCEQTNGSYRQLLDKLQNLWN